MLTKPHESMMAASPKRWRFVRNHDKQCEWRHLLSRILGVVESDKFLLFCFIESSMNHLIKDIHGAVKQPLRVKTPPIGGCFYNSLDRLYVFIGVFGEIDILKDTPPRSTRGLDDVKVEKTSFVVSNW